MSESSAFQALLWEVSNKVSAATELLKDTKARMETLAEEHGQMRERLARLEEDKAWKGEERREVKGRLETGDHTFLLLKAQAAAAEQLATQAFNEVKAMREDQAERTKVRRKHQWFFIEMSFKTLLPHFIKAAVVVILWVIYHFAVIAKLAEAGKSRGGTP